MAETFSEFLRENKKVHNEVEYAPTVDFTDKKGEPLKWRFRAITSTQFDDIRDKCTYNVPITGKKGQYRQQLNTGKLNAEMVAACVTYPDLENAALQDSYGVSTPTALLRAMVTNPGEYSDLVLFVNGLCGFDTSLEDDVAEVKN